MKSTLLPALPLLLVALAPPAKAEEITGADLLSLLSGQSFDCVQGQIPLEWHIAKIAADAKTVPYRAVVRGKTVEAEYDITTNGRLSSDGYGAERTVKRNADGTLTVTRADGKAMICTAR